MLFSQQFRNIRRIRHIIRVLLKHGFEDLVTHSSLKHFVSQKRRLTWKRRQKPVFEYTHWERIRMVVEELGPTFVKGAQVMSNRPDILPEPLIAEFQKLQSDVPPFEFEKAKEIVERELGKKLEEVFEYFNEKPIGSASIGQVHRAKLLNGEEVVVKVQRPGVKNTIQTDLAIVTEIVQFSENYLEKQGVINPMDIVRSFERSMQKELHYLNEARNIEQFRNFYKDYTNFYVPRVFKEDSTDEVMIIEFVDGCKITDVEKLTEWGLDPHAVAENGMKIYLTQIFEYGYFHADPHPGNVLVRPDGVVCLIDFGMVGTLMPKDKQAFAGVFISMAQQDAGRMARYFRKLAIDGEISDMRAFEYDLNELIEDFAVLDVGESSMAEMSTRLQKIIYDYRLRMPGGIFLILRALTILEGIGKTIHPEFNTSEFIKPYGVKLIQERYSPKNLSEEFLSSASQFISFMNSFPSEFKYILRKIRKGKLHIQVENEGFEPIIKKMDFVTNRIALTMIIVALLLSSSIAMNAEFAPEATTASGMPYVSLMGLSIAGGLSFVLLMAILRSGRNR